MDSTEDISALAVDVVSVSSSSSSMHKLRGALGDLGVHNGCARSHSTDSGFVTESDNTSHESAEAAMVVNGSEDMSTILECMCGANVNGEAQHCDGGDKDKYDDGDDGVSRGSEKLKNDCGGGDDEEIVKSMEKISLQQQQCPCCGKSIATSRLKNHYDQSQSHSTASHRRLHRLSEEEHNLSRERSYSAPLNPRKMNLTLDVTPLNMSSDDINNCNNSNEDDTGESGITPRASLAQPPASKQSWLLRLFESKLFDMTIAITYLYNSKEPGVQTYIGK